MDSILLFVALCGTWIYHIWRQLVWDGLQRELLGVPSRHTVKSTQGEGNAAVPDHEAPDEHAQQPEFDPGEYQRMLAEAEDLELRVLGGSLR